MKVLDNMMMLLIDMQGNIKALNEKIEALQNSEAMLFNPTEEKPEAPTAPPQPIAQ
jgi:hypothetical protein